MGEQMRNVIITFSEIFQIGIAVDSQSFEIDLVTMESMVLIGNKTELRMLIKT